MMSGAASHGRVHINRRLLTAGAALMAVGGLLGFAGVALGGTAVLIAVRQWVREMEVSPRERAAMTWRQAKQASLAGARAWRDAAPSPNP
jgi:hypothetical protein